MVLTSESYRSLEKDKTFINTKTHCPVHAGYSELGVSLPFSGQALLYLTVTHYLLCNVTHNLNVLGNGFRILTITLFGNSLIENSYSSTGDIFHFTYMRKLMVSVMSISATRPPPPTSLLDYSLGCITRQRMHNSGDFSNCYKLESTRERLTRGHHRRGYHFSLLKLGLISFSHYNHYFEI